MVSGSFPEGDTLPVSTSAVPVPPIIPPCHTYRTASGLMSSTKFISMMLPTFSRTMTFRKCFLTVRSILSSPSLSRYAPFSKRLSFSSPAVLPKITIAVWQKLEIFSARASSTGISSCDHGSPPQPSPKSKGCSFVHSL